MIPDIAPGPSRNSWILANLDSFQPEWHRAGSLTVAHDYFSIEGVRIPCDATTAAAVVAHFGGRLPTPAEVDVIWRASDVKLHPQPWGPPYGRSMLSVSRFVQHSARIDAQLADRTGLIAGHKKDIVSCSKPGMVAIYGWHGLNGKPIQQFNDWSHEAAYADYSHGVRIVKEASGEDGAVSGTIDDSPQEYPFIQSKNYRAAGGRQVNYVVLHTMESSEKPGTARAVAMWFAGTSAPMASAHFCVGPDEIIQCVHEGDVAFGAPGANNDGIHIEMAGRAAQSGADWSDMASTAILEKAASLVAALCFRFDVPVEAVDAAGLVARRRGITTHAAVSKAFKKSNHWDPGSNFPMDRFIDMVSAVS